MYVFCTYFLHLISPSFVLRRCSVLLLGDGVLLLRTSRPAVKVLFHPTGAASSINI